MLYLDFVMNREDVLTDKQIKYPKVLRDFIIFIKRNFRTSIQV